MTNSFEEQLIGVLKSHKCLYDYRTENYNNKEIKNLAWEDIAEKTNTSVNNCKIRWKSLRDRYTRERKLNTIANRPSTWIYYKKLNFLKDVCRKRTKTNKEDPLKPSTKPIKIEKLYYNDIIDDPLNYDDQDQDDEVDFVNDSNTMKSIAPSNHENNPSCSSSNNTNFEEMPTSYTSKDDIYYFGQLLVYKLRQLSFSICNETQLEILQLVNSKLNNIE